MLLIPCISILMKNIDFRDFFYREYDLRQRKNARYSMRAFARDLKIPAPKLSQILKGTCGLSAARGATLAEELGLSATEQRVFLCSLDAKFSRSPATRKKAQEKLRKQMQLDVLDIEQFRLVADWQHFAIMELLKNKPKVESMSQIADRLGLTKLEAEEAMARLEKLNLITKTDTGWMASEKIVSTTTDIPSRDIREHHRQAMNKGLSALEEVAVNLRDFSTLMMAVNEESIPAMKELINEFKDRFEEKFAAQKNSDRVYCLGIQLFPLDVRAGHQPHARPNKKSNPKSSFNINLKKSSNHKPTNNKEIL